MKKITDNKRNSTTIAKMPNQRENSQASFKPSADKKTRLCVVYYLTHDLQSE